MKKVIITLLLGLAGLAHASDATLWADYKTSRDAGKAALAKLEAGNTETAVYQEAVSAFAAASTTAAALNRSDIVAWQLNNSAFASILFFQNTVDYKGTTATLAAMKPSKDKMAAVAEAKKKFSEAFAPIEASATQALAEAGTIGAGDEALEAAVQSNKSFLVWVAKFLESK